MGPLMNSALTWGSCKSVMAGVAPKTNTTVSGPSAEGPTTP